MSLFIYKPNGKNTGHACNFQLTSTGESKGVYLNMIKQVSWDNAKKIGSFTGGAKVVVKFNQTEIAAMLDSLESGRDLSLFHTSGGVSTQIILKKWEMDGDHKGYGLRVTREKVAYGIPLTHGEARELRSWFEFALDRFHQSAYADYKKKRDSK